MTITPNAEGTKMGRIAPGTRLTVRPGTPEELAHEARRIRELWEPQTPPDHWVGHAWYVCLADDPEKVLKDWWSPVGGHDQTAALREARRYARARGAEVTSRQVEVRA